MKLQLLVMLVVMSLMASACQKKQVATPPPAGVFPQQVGKFKLSSEPHQSEYDAPEYRTYTASYSLPGNSRVDYEVKVYSKPPAEREGLPETSEVMFQSGSTQVAFVPYLERVETLINGTSMDVRAIAYSVADANEFANNLPYAQVGAVAPQTSVKISLPPPLYQKEPQDKIDEKLDKQLNDTMMETLKLWFQTKRTKANPRINKLDSSTLMTEADVSAAESDDLAKEFIKAMGDNLKKYGFRQFVISTSTYKI